MVINRTAVAEPTALKIHGLTIEEHCVPCVNGKGSLVKSITEASLLVTLSCSSH